MQLLNTQLQFAKDLSIGDRIVFKDKVWTVKDLAHYKNQKTLQMKLEDVSVDPTETQTTNYFADYTDLFQVLN